MTNSDLRSDTLPTTVRDFLAASTMHDADTALSFLVEDVVIVDQNETFRGREEVHAFLRGKGVDVSDYLWGRFCFSSDPDGNGWSVHGPLST